MSNFFLICSVNFEIPAFYNSAERRSIHFCVTSHQVFHFCGEFRSSAPHTHRVPSNESSLIDDGFLFHHITNTKCNKLFIRGQYMLASRPHITCEPSCCWDASRWLVPAGNTFCFADSSMRNFISEGNVFAGRESQRTCFVYNARISFQHIRRQDIIFICFYTKPANGFTFKTIFYVNIRYALCVKDDVTCHDGQWNWSNTVDWVEQHRCSVNKSTHNRFCMLTTVLKHRRHETRAPRAAFTIYSRTRKRNKNRNKTN